MRKMTAIGLAALEAREARRLKAYRCSEGVLTIGVGTPPRLELQPSRKA